MLNIQNQTLETTPISNANKNIVPLGTAQGNNPSLQINPTNNNTVNPVISPNISPTFTISPVINNQVAPTRTMIRAPMKLGPEPSTCNCPFCSEPIQTLTKTKMNLKAIMIGVVTLFGGLACYQICNDKKIGCQDVEHECPHCGYQIATYYAI